MNSCYPTKKEPCGACDGRGWAVGIDVEAMRQARLSHHLTQSDVARAAGWQASVVSELESGARPMTQASAERYWEALHEAERAGR